MTTAEVRSLPERDLLALYRDADTATRLAARDELDRRRGRAPPAPRRYFVPARDTRALAAGDS